MNHLKIICVAILLIGAAAGCYAEDRIELEVTTIKGNKELPKILYVVPWKEMQKSRKEEQKLELHSLFGDLFDPVIPTAMTADQP